MRGRTSLALVLLLGACTEPATSPSDGDGATATGGTSGSGPTTGGTASGGTAGSTATGGLSGSGSSSGAATTGGTGAGGVFGGSGGALGGLGGVTAHGGESSTSSGGAGGSTAGVAGTSGGAGGSAAGTAGTPGSAGAAGASSGAFSLVFRDDFNALDLARWQLMTHSWEGNLALFSTTAATATGGMLRLTLLPAPQGTVDSLGSPKSFLGAEVRSRETLAFGRVRTRARFADGSAVVAALVTIYTPWPADDWNELDVECLGADASSVQFNTMVYTGPRTTPPVATSVTPTQFPQKVDLGFDPSADFHVYTMEWTPSGARFLVDDVLRHSWTTRADLLGRPQNTLLTIWASSAPDWAGPVTSATGQAVALYDWVELYRFQPGP